jgi:hypothetical protein
MPGRTPACPAPYRLLDSEDLHDIEPGHKRWRRFPCAQPESAAVPYCLSFADQSPVLTVVMPDWPFFLASFFDSVHLPCVRLLLSP